MFGNRFFGKRFFGDRFYGQGGAGAPPATGSGIFGPRRRRFFPRLWW